MLRNRNEDLKFQRGHIDFSAVNDPAEISSVGSLNPWIEQELINRLLKGTVCMVFCLLYFRQLVTIRTTTHTVAIPISQVITSLTSY
jgi:hypothetical protein